MKKIVFLLFILISASSFAQELNCQVQVTVGPGVQNVDKRVFETLRQSIFEFMNNTKWTNEVYQNEERIDCSITLTINTDKSIDQFDASLQLTSRRPVYRTSYHSPVLSLNDPSIEFRYVEFQPLEFTLNQFTTNLTSILAYYAYIIIAYDYDSFSPLGGTQYFQRAQTIVANAQAASASEQKGWLSRDSDRNRYWLVENMLLPVFKPLRETIYNYHRKGLDVMHQDQETGRNAIAEALMALRQVHTVKPLSYNMQQFFTAKSDEVVNIFSQAFPDKKNQIMTLATEIDPANSAKYAKIVNPDR